MDTFSSKEDLITKTRKPYTITKQRERWTAEEHNRFLEAIKLYGRAWQKIEEHIGTKTAVQIRSHAQKFFSKLEKESLVKGAPIQQAHDIDIPPPRPKRKPNNPYPRKTSGGTPSSISVGIKDGILVTSASAPHSCKQMQDLENDLHHEKSCIKTRAEETFNGDNSSGILTLSQETPHTFFPGPIKSPSASVDCKNELGLKDFIFLAKQTCNDGAADESFSNTDPEQTNRLDRSDGNYTDLDDGTSEAPTLNNCCHNSDEDVVEGEKQEQPEKSNQNYPRHIPVHVLENISESRTQSASHGISHPASIIHQVEGTSKNASDLTYPMASASTENHSNISIPKPSPNPPLPLDPLCNNQDSCNMFVNTTFSNLIVSTLVQNPAAHAAASFAASFWPFTDVQTPSGTIEGFQSRHGGPPPSTSAIAAATVMAASAWWAAHGLLPLYQPLHTGLTCMPAPSNPSPTDANLVLVGKEEKNHSQEPDPEDSKAPKPKLSDSKFHLPSVPCYDKNESSRSNQAELEVSRHEEKPVSITGLHESDKGKTKEQVDRSSCGSNTPSSSEVEMDLREKCADNGKDDLKDLNVNHGTTEPNSHWTSEPNNIRSKSTVNMNESWKEVSEEGKLAFKALFSRQVLPQSFSPPKCAENDGQVIGSGEEGIQYANEMFGEDKLKVDLNSKAFSGHLDFRENEKEKLLSQDNSEKELFLMGCGHGKPRARRTGFKPYKRCSAEAKESTNESNPREEGDRKRVRLEGASA